MTPDTDRAKRAALKLIEHYGITEPAEIKLEDIAWGLGIDVREAALRNSEAQLIRKGKTGVIRIRHGEKDTARGRFSIGHEIGHWELHPDGNQYWICTVDQIHRYKGSSQEAEANAFSAELLMPTPLFRPLCRAGTFGLALADRLSHRFGTSLQATALRIVDETQEPAVVVLSDGERVCWSKRNHQKLGDFSFHIEKGRRLHPDSKAWGASVDGDASEELPARVWFPNLKEHWNYVVQEDVRSIEAYGLALSMIVVYDK